MSARSVSTVDCSGAEAHVEVVGEGPDVVMVGTAATMDLTRPAAIELSELGYRVTNFDYGTDALEPLVRSALAQVDDVVSVIDAVGIATATFIGVSRGAMTAYALAARHPHRADRLVLAFPVAGFGDTLYNPPAQEYVPETDDPMRAMLEQVFSAEYLESSVEAALSILEATPGTVDRLERFEEEAFDDEDSVEVATLILAGDADLVVDIEHPRRYEKAIPGAELIVLADASHGWILERPDEFARRVHEFLSG